MCLTYVKYVLRSGKCSFFFPFPFPDAQMMDIRLWLKQSFWISNYFLKPEPDYTVSRPKRPGPLSTDTSTIRNKY